MPSVIAGIYFLSKTSFNASYYINKKYNFFKKIKKERKKKLKGKCDDSVCSDLTTTVATIITTVTTLTTSVATVTTAVATVTNCFTDPTSTACTGNFVLVIGHKSSNNYFKDAILFCH